MSNKIFVTLALITRLLFALTVRDDDYEGAKNRQLVADSASGVFANDFSLEPEISAELTRPTQHGDLELSPNGSFTYLPNGGFTGMDSFAYTANDLVMEKVGYVTITIGLSTTLNQSLTGWTTSRVPSPAIFGRNFRTTKDNFQIKEMMAFVQFESVCVMTLWNLDFLQPISVCDTLCKSNQWTLCAVDEPNISLFARDTNVLVTVWVQSGQMHYREPEDNEQEELGVREDVAWVDSVRCQSMRPDLLCRKFSERLWSVDIGYSFRSFEEDSTQNSSDINISGNINVDEEESHNEEFGEDVETTEYTDQSESGDENESAVQNESENESGDESEYESEGKSGKDEIEDESGDGSEGENEGEEMWNDSLEHSVVETQAPLQYSTGRGPGPVRLPLTPGDLVRNQNNSGLHEGDFDWRLIILMIVLGLVAIVGVFAVSRGCCRTCWEKIREEKRNTKNNEQEVVEMIPTNTDHIQQDEDCSSLEDANLITKFDFQRGVSMLVAKDTV